MNTFFTADTHFGHNKILRFCKARGELWPTVEEHDKGLIELWNKTVSPKDTIFHLGDFAFLKKDKIKEIVSRLNGKIILISGNHDKHGNVKNVGFNMVFQSVVHRIGQQKIAMVHQPERIHFHDGVSFGLCGHIHEWWKIVDNSELIWYDRSTNPWTEIVTIIPKPIINVGVDQWDFAPVAFEELMPLIQQAERKWD